MSELKYTKGPWHCDGLAIYSRTDNDKEKWFGRSEKIWIASIFCGTPVQEDYDNANLIAAAPELLEALKDARDKLTYHPDFQTGGSLKMYNDAIAKAEGRS